MIINYTSIYFISVLFISLLIFYLLQKQEIWQTLFLFGISITVYSLISIPMTLILFISATINYGTALAIKHYHSQKIYFFIFGLVWNIGLLGYFKYTNFFITAFKDLIALRFNVQLETLTLLNLIVPIGISFYTFSFIAYNIDVYLENVNPVHNYLNLLLFAFFFPKILAGPIERIQNFIPQIDRKTLQTAQFSKAFELLMIGFFQKIIIADSIAGFYDLITFFQDPEGYTIWISYCGIMLYSLQIYNDFSGYTKIARGTSLFFGYDLPSNFDQPYFAKNIREFWQKWHISLTSWFRDYLYIPLGGNRKGKPRQYWNILIVFIISGLWHGASYNFVLWGLFHGILLIIFDFWHNNSRINKWKQALQDRIKWSKTHWRLQSVKNCFSIVVTFHFVAFLWIFFRITDLALITDVFTNFNHWDFAYTQDFLEFFKRLLLFGFLSLTIDIVTNSAKKPSPFEKIPYYWKTIIYFIFFLLFLGFQTGDYVPFIYEGF